MCRWKVVASGAFSHKPVPQKFLAPRADALTIAPKWRWCADGNLPRITMPEIQRQHLHHMFAMVLAIGSAEDDYRGAVENVERMASE